MDLKSIKFSLRVLVCWFTIKKPVHMLGEEQKAMIFTFTYYAIIEKTVELLCSQDNILAKTFFGLFFSRK